LHKRLVAAFIVMLFALSTVSAAAVFGHYTLGRLNSTAPYRIFDSELTPVHIPGPIGYVWPGGGLQFWNNDMIDNLALPPGYQSPFTPVPPFQLATNTYAPWGSILTSTADHVNKGDLIFAVNFTEPMAWTGSNPGLPNNILYTSIAIYVPPEFTPVTADWAGGDASNILSTITQDSASIYKADVKDPFGPGWWVIYIRLRRMVLHTR